MPELLRRRRVPFAVITIVLVVVCVAVARLPDSFVIAIELNRPFTSTQAGWAYRLLAFVAVGQGLYGGFVILRPERVKRARTTDPKVASLQHPQVISAVARNAAGMTLLTLVYGLAAFGVTGERGGFWLFPVLFALQAAWYFRLVGDVAKWIVFQPENEADEVPDALWRREPPDYSPPIARGLKEPAPVTTPAEPGPETAAD